MSFWQPGTKQQASEKPKVDKKDVIQDSKCQAVQLPDREVKTSLSKGVMTMKFMKRKAEANLEAVQMAEKRRKQLDSAWTTDGTRSLSLFHLHCNHQQFPQQTWHAELSSGYCRWSESS